MHTPTQTNMMWISHCGDGGRGTTIEILSAIREPPAASRNRRRPTPGLPLGKVEYKRCKRNPSYIKIPSHPPGAKTRRSKQITTL
jgi:hypothetical protein